MAKNKFYSLLNDTTFKYLLKNERTKNSFNDIVKYYTGIDIENFHLIDNELSSGNNYSSYKIDIILTNDKETVILNIELNRKYKKYVDTRNRRYLHTIAGKSKGISDYNIDRKTKQLNICGYEPRGIDLGNERLLLYNPERKIFDENFGIYYIYIPLEMKLCYNTVICKKLSLFMCNSYEEMKAIAGDDEELNLIVNEVEKLNKDKYFGALYDSREEQERLEASAQDLGFNEGHETGFSEGHDTGFNEGHETGFSEGHDTGFNEGIRETAKRMIESGIDKETISKITELSIEEINEIIEKK